MITPLPRAVREMGPRKGARAARLSRAALPLPGCTPMKPSSATLPFFGVEPAAGAPADTKFVCQGLTPMRKTVTACRIKMLISVCQLIFFSSCDRLPNGPLTAKLQVPCFIIDDKGNELEGPCEGFLVIKKPHPIQPLLLSCLYFSHVKIGGPRLHPPKELHFGVQRISSARID